MVRNLFRMVRTFFFVFNSFDINRSLFESSKVRSNSIRTMDNRFVQRILHGSTAIRHGIVRQNMFGRYDAKVSGPVQTVTKCTIIQCKSVLVLDCQRFVTFSDAVLVANVCVSV